MEATLAGLVYAPPCRVRPLACAWASLSPSKQLVESLVVDPQQDQWVPAPHPEHPVPQLPEPEQAAVPSRLPPQPDHVPGCRTWGRACQPHKPRMPQQEPCHKRGGDSKEVGRLKKQEHAGWQAVDRNDQRL